MINALWLLLIIPSVFFAGIATAAIASANMHDKIIEELENKRPKEDSVSAENSEKKHYPSELISLKPIVVVDNEADRLFKMIGGDKYRWYLSNTTMNDNKEQDSAFMNGFSFAIQCLLSSPNKIYGTMMTYSEYESWCKEHNIEIK